MADFKKMGKETTHWTCLVFRTILLAIFLMSLYVLIFFTINCFVMDGCELEAIAIPISVVVIVISFGLLNLLMHFDSLIYKKEYTELKNHLKKSTFKNPFLYISLIFLVLSIIFAFTTNTKIEITYTSITFIVYLVCATIFLSFLLHQKSIEQSLNK